MTDKEKLSLDGYYSTIVFDNPEYEGALIGVSTDRRAVYDYELMVKGLMEKSEMNEEEATNFQRRLTDKNTVRASEYLQNGPIIIHKLEEM